MLIFVQKNWSQALQLPLRVRLNYALFVTRPPELGSPVALAQGGKANQRF
jgi:hypothetical protein